MIWQSGGEKSQANQKSPSAALPWGYSSPINVLFAKITDNSTIEGGRCAGEIKERSSGTTGEKLGERERETRREKKRQAGGQAGVGGRGRERPAKTLLWSRKPCKRC